MAIYILAPTVPACTLSTQREGQGRTLPGWGSGIPPKMWVPNRL